MPRLSPQTKVIRALFARSGNQCAFPGCTQPLVNEDNVFIGQICHIEAVLPGGERYNADQDDETLRGYDNLILLCYEHHCETNDVTRYSVEALKEIKLRHEKLHEKSDFKISETTLFKIINEMGLYWNKIEKIHTEKHLTPEIALEIKAKASFSN